MVVHLEYYRNSLREVKTSVKLIKYFLGQSASVHLLLQKPSSAFSAEDFHMLRVYIKKMKAIFSLVQSAVKSFDQEKYFTPYKTIFRQAGRVRELQLEQSLISKYKLDPVLAQYYNRLESEIRNEQNAFFGLTDKKLKRKLKKNTTAVIPLMEKVDSSAVKKFLVEKRNIIELLLHGEKTEAGHVHELRKRIKELYYLQKIFQPKNKRLAVADDFQELLGQWHDYDVIREDLLKDAQNHKLKPEEVKAIMKIQKKISSHADRLFRKIEFDKATD